MINSTDYFYFSPLCHHSPGDNMEKERRFLGVERRGEGKEKGMAVKKERSF